MLEKEKSITCVPSFNRGHQHQVLLHVLRLPFQADIYIECRSVRREFSFFIYFFHPCWVDIAIHCNKLTRS